uniref:Uncharacterized protein n=1 Tax=Panagrolaimus superbus TaxID=310955 RepID=A0A914Z4I2_9BILA
MSLPLEAEVETEETEEVEVKNEESEESDEDEQGEEENSESEAEEEEELDESENVEVVEEEEIFAEAAALHFVEPAKVASKFEELSKTLDTPFDQFFESISTPESGTRSLIFAIVMLITVMGAGFGHYIGACLIGNQSSPASAAAIIGGPFCYESDRITTTTFSSLPQFLMQHSGLQYQDISSSIDEATLPPSTSSPLQQCKENLYDAQAEVKMKSGVNRFVRENYKRQLQKAKQDFESRLESYKRASRRLLASKYSTFEQHQSSLPKPSKTSSLKPEMKNEEEKEFICKSFEQRPFLNLTRSIFSSVSNWSSNNSVVKNFVSLFY